MSINKSMCSKDYPEYPGWKIAKRYLVDGYPLAMLEKDEKKIFLSEGIHKNIIEFLLAVSESSFEWNKEPEKFKNDINFIMHKGFISEQGRSHDQGIFYGYLVQPEEFEAWKVDPEFIEEMERYQKYTRQTLNEPVWDVRVSSGYWRQSANFIVQSSIEKIIRLKQNLIDGDTSLPEGVVEVSD